MHLFTFWNLIWLHFKASLWETSNLKKKKKNQIIQGRGEKDFVLRFEKSHEAESHVCKEKELPNSDASAHIICDLPILEGNKSNL